MSRPTSTALVGILLLSALLAGCGRYRRYQTQVRSQASGHLQCPIEQVQAERVARRTWRVAACGRVIDYNCHRVRGVGLRCQQSPIIRYDSAVMVASNDSTLPPPVTAGAEVQVQVQAPGPYQNAPEQQVLVGGSEAAVPDAWPLLEVESAPDALRQLQPAIQACMVERSTLVVRWSTDGTVQGHLDGARAGSDSDRCIQTLFSRLRIRAPGAGGTLVQEFAAR